MLYCNVKTLISALDASVNPDADLKAGQFTNYGELVLCSQIVLGGWTRVDLVHPHCTRFNMGLEIQLSSESVFPLSQFTF